MTNSYYNIEVVAIISVHFTSIVLSSVGIYYSFRQRSKVFIVGQTISFFTTTTSLAGYIDDSKTLYDSGIFNFIWAELTNSLLCASFFQSIRFIRIYLVFLPMVTDQLFSKFVTILGRTLILYMLFNTVTNALSNFSDTPNNLLELIANVATSLLGLFTLLYDGSQSLFLIWTTIRTKELREQSLFYLIIGSFFTMLGLDILSLGEFVLFTTISPKTLSPLIIAILGLSIHVSLQQFIIHVLTKVMSMPVSITNVSGSLPVPLSIKTNGTLAPTKIIQEMKSP